jgi:hypothetical protein
MEDTDGILLVKRFVEVQEVLELLEVLGVPEPPEASVIISTANKPP